MVLIYRTALCFGTVVRPSAAAFRVQGALELLGEFDERDV
jgi:hypothetical protein